VSKRSHSGTNTGEHETGAVLRLSNEIDSVAKQQKFPHFPLSPHPGCLVLRLLILGHQLAADVPRVHARLLAWVIHALRRLLADIRRRSYL
jgi:hypothetical protein